MTDIGGAITEVFSELTDLVPLTWRGVPVQMYSSSITMAPQVHLHIGAFWPYPVPEDLGTAPTLIKISGFLDPSFAFIERPILEALITQPGAGLLTHPTKGLIYAHCLSATFNDDISNIVEISMEFVQVNSLLGAIDSLLGTNLEGAVNSAVSSVQSSVSSAIGSSSSVIAGII
jgi:DNA circularisation protein N-terminus